MCIWQLLCCFWLLLCWKWPWQSLVLGLCAVFLHNYISPLCVMKFTHILKAWLAYILYWHSGNMFSLSLSIRLSSLRTFPSLFPLPCPPPRRPPLSVFALWSSAVPFSVIFIYRTRRRRIAAIIYSKLHFFPSFRFYIFTAELLVSVVSWSAVRSPDFSSITVRSFEMPSELMFISVVVLHFSSHHLFIFSSSLLLFFLSLPSFLSLLLYLYISHFSLFSLSV